MTNPYDSDLSRFAATFMRAILAWNNAEDSARQILIDFGGRGIGLRIAAAHLGSRTMKDALLTLCDCLGGDNAPGASEVGSHVAHFVEGLDTLRGYRNFYVHSLRSVGKSPDNPKAFQGFLASVEARGRLAFVRQNLTTEELEVFMRHTQELQTYGNGIANFLQGMGRTNALAALLPPPQPLSSLQRPTWPEKLKKHRSYLGEQ